MVPTLVCFSKLVITTLSEIAFVALKDASIDFLTFYLRVWSTYGFENIFLLQSVFHLNRRENGINDSSSKFKFKTSKGFYLHIKLSIFVKKIWIQLGPF